MSSFMHSPIQRLRTISSSFRQLTGADEDPYGNDDGRESHTLDLATQLNDWANTANEASLYSDHQNHESMFSNLNGFSQPTGTTTTRTTHEPDYTAHPNSSSSSLHHYHPQQQHYPDQHHYNDDSVSEFGSYSMVQHSQLNTFDMDVDDSNTASLTHIDSTGHTGSHQHGNLNDMLGSSHDFQSSTDPASSQGELTSSVPGSSLQHRTRAKAGKVSHSTLATYIATEHRTPSTYPSTNFLISHFHPHLARILNEQLDR